MMRFIFILVIILLIQGCGSVSSIGRPNDYYRSSQNNDQQPLVGNAEAILVDQEIGRLLNYRLALPAKNRIAILKLSNDNYWQGYSDDFTFLNESIVTDFVGQMRASERVYDASFLPGMLVPQQRTVSFLREAAARFQADLLLVYRTECRSFEKYQFIDPNVTKAYCSVEAVILDVRSGVIPFTHVTSNEFSAKKSAEDTNFHETIKKAELAAIAKSLKQTAAELTRFLSSVATLP